MSRIRNILSLGLLVVAMVAAVAAPAGAKAEVERPYKGSEQVTVTIDLGSCSEAFVCVVTTTGTGTASHLGKISTTSVGQITFLGFCTLSNGFEYGSLFTAEGSFVATAANGDELHGEYANGGCADGDGIIPGTIDGTQTIVGGTGRFENASGSTVTTGTNIGPLSWAGTLKY